MPPSHVSAETCEPKGPLPPQPFFTAPYCYVVSVARGQVISMRIHHSEQVLESLGEHPPLLGPGIWGFGAAQAPPLWAPVRTLD